MIPLGDPPLLAGYLGGVLFFWTLLLLLAWLLHLGSAARALYVTDRRAFAGGPGTGLTKETAEVEALGITKSWQLCWASDSISSIFDNVPAPEAFASVARGVSAAGPTSWWVRRRRSSPP